MTRRLDRWLHLWFGFDDPVDRRTYFVFRLAPLPGGRTRLEGRTWYALDLAPSAYWAVWSDAIVHAIHARVLAHVKRLAETEAASRMRS